MRIRNSVAKALVCSALALFIAPAWAQTASPERLQAALAERGYDSAPDLLSGDTAITWQPGGQGTLSESGFVIRLPQLVDVDRVLVGGESSAVIADLSKELGPVAITARIAEALKLQAGATVDLRIIGLRRRDQSAEAPNFAPQAREEPTSPQPAVPRATPRLTVRLSSDVFAPGALTRPGLLESAAGPVPTTLEEPETASSTALNFRGTVPVTTVAPTTATATPNGPAKDAEASSESTTLVQTAPEKADIVLKLEPSEDVVAPTPAPTFSAETSTAVSAAASVSTESTDPIPSAEPTVSQIRAVQTTQVPDTETVAPPAQAEAPVAIAPAPSPAAAEQADSQQIAALSPATSAAPSAQNSAPTAEQAPTQTAQTSSRGATSSEEDPLLTIVPRDQIPGSGNLILQVPYFSQSNSAQLLASLLSRRGVPNVVRQVTANDGTPRWTVLIGPFESQEERDAAKSRGGDLLKSAVKRRI